jgi:hypothetical protein
VGSFTSQAVRFGFLRQFAASRVGMVNAMSFYFACPQRAFTIV